MLIWRFNIRQICGGQVKTAGCYAIIVFALSSKNVLMLIKYALSLVDIIIKAILEKLTVWDLAKNS